jgi:rhodanese-related sulfurtransferase
MKTLNKQQLEENFGSNDDTLLINVLPRENFEKAHIPASINIPIESDDFIQQVEKQTENKNQKIIVYCASFDCDASTKAAQKLEEAGYTNVYDFKGGMQEWQEGGGEVGMLQSASDAGATAVNSAQNTG